MNLVRQFLFALLVTSTLSTVFSCKSLGQGDDGIEAKFTAALKNVTLKGSWAPVQQGKIGDERTDAGYRIARVEKKDGDSWSIVSIFKFNDQEMEFPIPAKVKFAGDTAILILDNTRAGRGKANWSARVMFHKDVYAGRWWETDNREHGGTIAGTIVRDEKWPSRVQ
ncbi:MAG: hypothetical protein NTW52_08840 [Planctomycetota bacterium]|nr:hypothetical protein [Planctomycetota bacterium]